MVLEAQAQDLDNPRCATSVLAQLARSLAELAALQNGISLSPLDLWRNIPGTPWPEAFWLFPGFLPLHGGLWATPVLPHERGRVPPAVPSPREVCAAQRSEAVPPTSEPSVPALGRGTDPLKAHVLGLRGSECRNG